MEPEAVPQSEGVESTADRIDRQLRERLARATNIKVFIYQCTNPKCRALDRGKFFDHEPCPPFCGQMINCWKCGNGRKCKNVDEMVASSRGMAVIRVENLVGEEITA